MSPSPLYLHQLLVLKLAMDVYLSETEAYQPNVLFISNERKNTISDRVHGARDHVMEVLSPSTAYYDLTKKKRVYSLHGVTEYGIVDSSEKTVEVLENRNGYDHEVSGVRETGRPESRLLDGFAIDAGRFFASLQG